MGRGLLVSPLHATSVNLPCAPEKHSREDSYGKVRSTGFHHYVSLAVVLLLVVIVAIVFVFIDIFAVVVIQSYSDLFVLHPSLRVDGADKQRLVFYFCIGRIIVNYKATGQRIRDGAHSGMEKREIPYETNRAGDEDTAHRRGQERSTERTKQALPSTTGDIDRYFSSTQSASICVPAFFQLALHNLDSIDTSAEITV